MSYPKFPHEIRQAIKVNGRGSFPFDNDGFHELVIDDLGRAWVAVCGILAPWLFADRGTVPNYADPRTSYRSHAIGDGPDGPDDVRSFGWFDDDVLVEEHPTREVCGDGYNPVWSIPPDRREEWTSFFASYETSYA